MNLPISLELTRIPAEDEALQAPLRDFLKNALATRPTEARARSRLGFDAAFSRSLGEHGWLGLTLPKAYDGQTRRPIQAITASRWPKPLRIGASAPQIVRRGALSMAFI